MQSTDIQSSPKFERFREAIGRRTAGIILVLFVEALLLLILLTLNQSEPEEERVVVPISTFTLPGTSQEQSTPEAASESTADPAEAQDTQQESQSEPPPLRQPIRPDTTSTTRVPPPVIPLTPNQMEAGDISNLPARPNSRPVQNGQTMGPPAPRGGSAAGDSQRVEGSGPNGEPLYAAAWYREPRSDELRGYLQTAQGPGWGLIMCRTVADYRVEDCELVAEYPRGSNIGRSILAAAWHFRVQPPRIGGEFQVGAWVRIRIDYDIRRR